MTAFNGPRRILADALIITAAALVAIGRLDVVDGLGLVVVGVLVGVSLTLRMQLPQGGSIPMGHAVVIATAAQLSTPSFTLVCVVAIAAGRAVSAGARREEWSGRRIVGAIAGMLAAGVVAAAVHPHVPARGADSWAHAAFLAVLAIGLAHVAVDILVESRSFAMSWRTAVPVYVSLVCSAALLGMAQDWMLLFAALPLLITWYSFERYAAARGTYEQTIQALGIVPELAGHVSLGHGERSAAYARALADALQLSPAQRDVVVPAARLHHVGHVAVPDREETKPAIEDALVASASGRILRDSGFLPEIAHLVEAQAAPDPDDVVVSILRVASAFDDLVGEDAARGRGALAILQGRDEGRAWRTVAGVLRSLIERDEGFVARAIAEGAPLTAAAAAARATEPALR